MRKDNIFLVEYIGGQDNISEILVSFGGDITNFLRGARSFFCGGGGHTNPPQVTLGSGA